MGTQRSDSLFLIRFTVTNPDIAGVSPRGSGAGYNCSLTRSLMSRQELCNAARRLCSECDSSLFPGLRVSLRTSSKLCDNTVGED